MPRTTIAELDRAVADLEHASGQKFFIDYSSGSPVMRQRGGGLASPMLSAGKLADWIRVFTWGVDHGRRLPKRRTSRR
jgi:hypothetical protein